MTFTRKGMGRVVQIFSPPIVKQVLMDSEVSGNFNYRTASLSDEADSLKFKFPVVFPATM